MKKKIAIANWKMNLSLGERDELAEAVKRELGKVADKDVVICPSTISLMQVGKIISNSSIQLGAQDVFWEETGAYTGETSPSILKAIDCLYAIVGHSERRKYVGETDEMVNKKIDACLENGLTPIFCVGETDDERSNGLTDNVILNQLKRGLKGIELVSDEQIVVAYEPVWAIGSGNAVEPRELDRVLQVIKQAMIDLYPLTIAQNNVRMVYGGSVDADNISGFLELDLLDGFLIGGASLNIDKFKKIVESL